MDGAGFAPQASNAKRVTIMHHGRYSWGRRLRAAGGVWATFFSFVAFSVAQESAPPTASLPPSFESSTAPPATLPSIPTEAVAPAPGAGDLPKPEAPKPEPPFWSKVPPLSPNPRLGNPFLFPTGPGYYSFSDWIRGNYREAPPKNPWPPFSIDAFPFFDNDFRYLENPDNKQHDFWDPIKRIHPNDNWLFSFGGEERFRYANEPANGIRLTGVNNEYQLNRVRLYGDMWYLDRLRIYAEYIDAQSYNENIASLPIDVNRSDMLNLFADLKLLDIQDHGLYFRAGRQQLVYGSQRLISPLDWANIPRTFEGFKGFWHSEKLDVDLFWVQPMAISPSHFDSADHSRGFAGLWTTYRPKKGHVADVYYLFLDQHDPVAAVVPPGGRGGFNVNTIGSRYLGEEKHWLWDVEGMWQFGTITDNSISAGAATTGVGYHWPDAPMNPAFWIYNDFASGDDSGGRGGTFNQLFPFGHYYMGFIDAVGRQNIDDFNLHFYCYPTKWIIFGLQAHFFYLASAKDALYNGAGVPTRRDPTGRAGYHVGDEIDWISNFHIDMHQDVMVGYSQLFPGEFIRNTGPSRSPGFFYLQYSYRW